MMECDPRRASPRTARRTSAPGVVAVAKHLELPVLPWQRRTLSVALERVRGVPAYRDVVVSVPRQSGKSSLALALMIERMLSAPDQTVIYGAQTRAAARVKLLNAWWPRISRSSLGGRFELYRGFGAETLTADNGSVLTLLASRESAGHGETTDLAVLDEAWVHADARVEQSIRPTMATRRDAQLWIMSTAGTARSVWWNAKLDAARAAAEMGISTGVACFDWGAADNANPADEGTWWQAMPALGRLIAVDTVRTDLANMPIAEFCRAFLNMAPDASAEGWQWLTEDEWEAARDD
jgi:phage terminase large subunit-like protein